MAASMTASAFVGQQVFRPCSSSSRGRCCRRPNICCAATDQQRDTLFGAKQLAVGLAAALLVHSTPANAGVVLQKRSLKKVFQSEPVERVKEAAGAVKEKVAGGGAAPSLPKVNLPSGGGANLSLLTLPLAIGGIAGGAFLLSKVDSGFSAFINDTIVKDSNRDGAGYQPSIIDGGNMRKSSSRPVPKKAGTKAGTKKISLPRFGKK